MAKTVEIPKPPQFHDYPEDLEKVGKAFVDAVKKVQAVLDKLGETAIWTDFVLDWFSATAAEGRVVDARPRSKWSSPTIGGISARKTLGEFMLDMTHSTFPDYKHGIYTEEYWAALPNTAALDLALECEFGKSATPSISKFMVFEDAAKLAVIRAKVKVLVFGSADGELPERFIETIEKLRTGAGDTAPWLWIDLPWEAGRAGWSPSMGVLPARQSRGGR